MSFVDLEQAGADIVALYRFTIGAAIYTYTDGDADYPYNGEVYVPEGIKHGQLQQSEENNSMTLDVTLPALNPVANFFRTPYLPGQHVWLTLYEIHNDVVEVPAVRFRGLVGQVTFEDITCTLNCLPLARAVNRRIPIQLVQRHCTNTLYDARCLANPDALRVDRTITAIAGLHVTLDAPTGHPEGFYDGGFINNGVKDLPASIRKDNGDGTLDMLYNTGWVVGDVVGVFAGCDKRLETCAQKFANVDHYQGFPFMPNLDPFSDEIP